MDRVLEAKKILAQVRRDSLKEMRRLDLESTVDFFEKAIRPLARPAEVSAYESLIATAKRAIDRTDSTEFEAKLSDLRNRNFEILWRQDWFVVDRFNYRCAEPHLFPDQSQFAALVGQGKQALATDDLSKLRQIVYLLDSMRVGPSSSDDLLADSNLVRH
jgi:molecular chaperone DnaK